MTYHCAPWGQTHSGRAVDLLAPQPDQIWLPDIATHLARIPRFVGATRTAYSVAQHSVLAEATLRNVPQNTRLLVLLHDAHEAYTGDFTSPVKAAIRERSPAGADAIKALQQDLQLAIHHAFGFPGCESEAEANAVAEAIRTADMLMLAAEKRDLMAPEPRSWGALPDPAGVPTIEPWSDITAEFRFAGRVRRLMAGSLLQPLATLGLFR